MEIAQRTVTSPKGDITIYKMTNETGASVEISTLGAGIVSINVPDKDGKLSDVVIGYANPSDYFYDGPCGRVPFHGGGEDRLPRAGVFFHRLIKWPA